MILNILLCLAILAFAVACVAVGAAVVLALILRWVAKGESDVNGDPERDAGYSDDKLTYRSFPSMTNSRPVADETILHPEYRGVSLPQHFPRK
jgi:hypothetical protein